MAGFGQVHGNERRRSIQRAVQARLDCCQHRGQHDTAEADRQQIERQGRKRLVGACKRRVEDSGDQAGYDHKKEVRQLEQATKQCTSATFGKRAGAESSLHEELIERPITVVHIVGGGTQNRLLNQFTANATGRPVVTGPVEATAIGNILMQMLAVGQINALSEGRDIVRRSFPVETYQPEDSGAWQDAYQGFVKLIEG